MTGRALVVVLALAACATGVAAQESSGSGFFVNSHWVLTNQHVVEDCARVTLPGHGAVTDIVSDKDSDLAALRVGRALGGDALSFRAGRARLAENVHVLGYPLTGVLSDDLRVTSGSISALSAFQTGDGLLQISAPVQPGNSGGPALDDNGHILGVTVGILREKGAQNVNFAISAALAQNFLTRENIRFAVAPQTAPERSLPDVIEAASGAIVQVLCHGGSAPRARPDLADAGQVGPFTILPDRDVVGFDYDALRGLGFAECSLTCAAETRCAAFTFNTRHSVCFLKEDALITVTNSDALSGIATPLMAELYESSIRVSTNQDSPGGDYSRLRDSNFTTCLLACGADDICRGFAFVRETRDCWLKDRLGPLQSMQGVEFGFK